MGWGLGDIFNSVVDPAGVFSGDKGDIVGNLLDPVGGTMNNWGLGEYNPLSDTHDDVNNWMDSMADTNSVVAQDRWKKVKDNPQRLLYSGGDLYTSYNPVGTRIANKWEGDSSSTPAWDIYGGKTPENYQDAENRGINTANSRGLGQIGSTVGKGFLNAYTFGLGSTAADALNSWGYGDNSGASDILKKGAKNYAINYLGNNALDYAGASIPETGGYSDADGFVSNNDYGGTGGFNLGKTIGAGDYSPQVNAVGKSAATGAINTSLQGGNSTNIGKSALNSGAMTGVKQGVNMAGDYLGSMFNQDNQYKTNSSPAMSSGYGMSPAVVNMSQAGDVSPYTPQTQPIQTEGMSYNPEVPTYSPTTSNGMRESAMGYTPTSSTSSSPVNDFVSAITGSGGTSNGLGNYGDLAGSLFGMYNANKQRRRLQGQQDSLQNLFTPNSPYAQMARQRMERQDAASGRRSQYGNRETQLAALLADKQASTMPQQNQYANQIGQYDNAMANNGLRFGGQFYKQAPQINSDLQRLFQYFQGSGQ